jgi:hypothetical protein
MTSPIPATEIANISVKSGVDINDKSSKAYQVWQDVLSQVAKVDGFVAQRYGHILEDASVVQYVICMLLGP